MRRNVVRAGIRMDTKFKDQLHISWSALSCGFLGCFALVVALSGLSDRPVFSRQKSDGESFNVSFVNAAKQAGLTHKTVYGDEHKNKYLLETTGCGVALFDYDNDGWLDIFFVNGTRLNLDPKIFPK